MQIFAGSSNPQLAKKIAKLTESKQGKIELTKFDNGETRVRVTEPKVEEKVVVVQSLSSPTNDHLIEFLLICDSLTRAGAKEIIAVIPWMGYSKQDKIFRSGEPLSSKVIAQVIQTAKLAKIITLDLHNRATLGYFDIPVKELGAKPLFIKMLKSYINQNTIVVAPDEGAIKNSGEIAGILGLPIAYIDKKRNLQTGKVSISGISRRVKGKEIIMVDDNIFTGETMMETAKLLKKRGALKITAAVTHHLHIPGVQTRLDECGIDKLIVTDTVKTGISGSNTELITVAGVIAQELI